MTAPGPRPWWTGITAAQMSLPCGDGEHQLRWSEGRLTAVDHPDVDRERALVALGGERVACLDLLDAWNAHTDDLDLLVLAARGPSDRLLETQPDDGVRYSGGYTRRSAFTAVSNPGGPGHSRPGRRGGWTMYLPLNSGGSHGHDLTAARLANLPDGLTTRLVATVIATWTDRIRDGDDRVTAVRPTLHAALYGRVLATAYALDIHSRELDVVMVEAQAPRSVSSQDGRIRCELPFSWLGDVWVRGFATALGHLCLNVETTQSEGWQLLVADRDLRGTRTMTINVGE
jgi:hypothetical protein